MQNFAGEMHHHELRHLSSTLLEEIKAWSSSCPLLLAQGSMEVRSITGDSAVVSRQWVGELPSFGPSGKGEHRRHIVTTGQNLSVATSTFSLHLQLECIILSRSSFEKPLSEYIYIYAQQGIYISQTKIPHVVYRKKAWAETHNKFQSDKQLRHRRNSHRILFPK